MIFSFTGSTPVDPTAIGPTKPHADWRRSEVTTWTSTSPEW